MWLHLCPQGRTPPNHPTMLLQCKGELGKTETALMAHSLCKIIWDIWSRDKRYCPFCASAVFKWPLVSKGRFLDSWTGLWRALWEVVMALYRQDHRGFGEIIPFTQCLLGLGLHRIGGKCVQRKLSHKLTWDYSCILLLLTQPLTC